MRSSFGHRSGGTSLSWYSAAGLLGTVAIVTVGLVLIPDNVVNTVEQFARAASPWLGIASVLLILWAIRELMRL